MGCYAATMVDCHRAVHGKGPQPYPTIADMTNTMSGKPSDGIKTIHSKIDYTLCSTSLAARVSCCTIDHARGNGPRPPVQITMRH